MELKADSLTEEDVREPMVLVKEYRRTNRRKGSGNRFRIYYVPRSGGFEDGGDSAGLGACDEDVCVLNGERIEVDDSYEDDDLCVEFTCVAPGTMEADELRNCDKSK